MIAVAVGSNPLGSYAAGRQNADRTLPAGEFDLEQYLNAGSFGGQAPALRVMDFVRAAYDPEDQDLLADTRVVLTGFVTEDDDVATRITSSSRGSRSAVARPTPSPYSSASNWTITTSRRPIRGSRSKARFTGFRHPSPGPSPARPSWSPPMSARPSSPMRSTSTRPDRVDQPSASTILAAFVRVRVEGRSPLRSRSAQGLAEQLDDLDVVTGVSGQHVGQGARR